MIVDPEQPMIRTPKGTVQKKATIKVYEAKINSLYIPCLLLRIMIFKPCPSRYSDVETTHQSSSGSIRPTAWTTDGVLSWLTAHANAVSLGGSLDPCADLFAQGFDRCDVQTSRNSMTSPQFCSLSATYIRNQIVIALGNASDAHVRDSVSLVSPNIVFENPTIQLLAAWIASLADKRGVSHSMDLKQQHVAAMNTMIETYSVGLSGSAELPVGVASHPNREVVLLTGSTGGLGSFLLSQLLENPTVERVYALNRPSSSTLIEERQSSAFVDKGLSVDLLTSGKLVHVEADASRDNCGFSPELYEQVWNAHAAVFAMLNHKFRSETR